jgi:hypothetical protein
MSDRMFDVDPAGMGITFVREGYVRQTRRGVPDLGEQP